MMDSKGPPKGGGHRRSTGANTVSFAMEDGPMSTTKALMVSIVVPRLVATSKLDLEDEDATVATATTAATGKSITSTAMKAMTTKKPDAEVKTKEPGTPPAIPAASSIQEVSKKVVEKLTGSTVSSDEKIVEEEKEEEPTPEEAAHVVVNYHKPEENEVNVEALLRLTLKTLLEEWHMLTIPTYTRTDRHLSLQGAEAVVEAGDGWIQVQFMARTTSLAVILDRLERIGVGTNCGSLSVYKAELCRTTSAYAQAPVEEQPPSETSLSGSERSKDSKDSARQGGSTRLAATLEGSEEGEEVVDSKQLMQERAIEAAKMEWKNAATRLRIEQVREQIAEQAAMTFDYMALLTIASILAGVGLITNNTVVIVASMLVSPIMGPVLGLTFGSRIFDWPLVWRSLANETLSLFGCVFIGALVGICGSFTSLAANEWPTNEMQIRGEATGLITGIAIAIPSGMGVCLSVLGGNTSSLVGVAISASLLPPAVNAGVCFVFSFFLAVGAVESTENKTAEEFAIVGSISFALTALNIFCIWVSGLIMFEIKEVAPAKAKGAFWAKDIKVARELNKGAGENPPPVDISIIKHGIKSALAKENSTSNVNETVVFGPQPLPVASPRGGRKWMRKASSGNLDEAFPLSQTPETTNLSQRGGGGGGGGGLAAMFGSLFSGFGGSSQPAAVEEDDNVRYVGLEDMAALLGFDKEDDDYYADHENVANHIGTGRYI